MKIFAIGDIHGHLVALEALLEVVPFSTGDLLVFLGDYVDKGPDVRGVLDFLCAFSGRPNTVFLRGNHDQMLVDACLDSSKIGIWECLAGPDPLASYGAGSTEELLGSFPEVHLQFLRNRCLDHYESARFIFVHGGIRPSLAPAQEDADHLQWLTLSMALPHDSGRTVVCGHSALASGQIADLSHTICIDTGISKGGLLTCLELTDFDYWQSTGDGRTHRGQIRRRD
jgi:serine/threonine protein phosphatase 1